MQPLKSLTLGATGPAATDVFSGGTKLVDQYPLDPGAEYVVSVDFQATASKFTTAEQDAATKLPKQHYYGIAGIYLGTGTPVLQGTLQWTPGLVVPAANTVAGIPTGTNTNTVGVVPGQASETIVIDLRNATSQQILNVVGAVETDDVQTSGAPSYGTGRATVTITTSNHA